MVWKRGDRNPKPRIREAIADIDAPEVVSAMEMIAKGGRELPELTLSPLTKEGIQEGASHLIQRIIAGAPRSQVIHAAMNYFKVTYLVAQDMINAAFRLIEDDVLDYIERETPLALARRNNLYQLAYERGDTRTCLEIQKDIDHLRGNYSAEKSTKKPEDVLAELITSMNKQAQQYTIIEQEPQALEFVVEGIPDSEEDLEDEIKDEVEGENADSDGEE